MEPSYMRYVCMYVQSDQKENKLEQALQIIGHVIATL
jgi:hypothetical protein